MWQKGTISILRNQLRVLSTVVLMQPSEEAVKLCCSYNGLDSGAKNISKRQTSLTRSSISTQGTLGSFQIQETPGLYFYRLSWKRISYPGKQTDNWSGSTLATLTNTSSTFVQVNPNGTTGPDPPNWLYFCGDLSFYLGRFSTCHIWGSTFSISAFQITARNILLWEIPGKVFKMKLYNQVSVKAQKTWYFH